MERVGIFGGTFDPPHRGHVEAAARAAEELALDRLLIIPTAVPPHKQLSEGAPLAEHRLEMARLAFGGIPRAQVSDAELRRGGKSYTVRTLEELCAAHPDWELWLIVGADMFLCLESWREPERLLALCSVAAMRRQRDDDGQALFDKARWLEERYGAHCRVLSHTAFEVSSTDIRGGHPAEDARVPAAVRDYILREGLYGRAEL